jgi:hypothetical protein
VFYNLLRKYRHIVKGFQVRKFKRLQNAHELVMELTFKDDSKLALKDYLFLDGNRKYAYHWQNKEGNLLIRWDNAGHWKDLSTFPHHKHVEKVENVEDSNVRNVDQALEFISNRIEKEE